MYFRKTMTEWNSVERFFSGWRWGVLLMTVVLVGAGCGGGGSSGGGGGGGGTRTVEVPTDVEYSMSVTRTAIGCTGTGATVCIANGVEQYRIQASITATGEAAGTLAPVGLVVTAPEGARIHLDSAADSVHYQSVTVSAVPDGAALTFYVRATESGNYSVSVSHIDSGNPNLTTLIQNINNVVFEPDPTIPTEVEIFEANDFLLTVTGGSTTVKAQLRNQDGDVITGTPAAAYQLIFTSTDPLGIFTPSTPVTLDADGTASVTFTTTTLYPDGGTLTVRAALSGNGAIFDDEEVTVFEDVGAPVRVDWGVVSRLNALLPNPVNIPELSNLPTETPAGGGLDGWVGLSQSRADEFRIDIRIISADEDAQNAPCNAYAPGVGNVVCLREGTQIQVSCENALDPNDSSIVLNASDCGFSSTANGAKTPSILVSCGDSGTADSCVNSVFLRVTRNSVKVRSGAGFTKIFPQLKFSTAGPVVATPPATRRYGSQAALAPVDAGGWGTRNFIGKSVAGEENRLRLRPDPALPFIVKWVDPTAASTPLGGCTVTPGVNTAGLKIAQCPEKPILYAPQCFAEGGAFNSSACSTEVNTRCGDFGIFRGTPADICSNRIGEGITNIPRIPLRLQLLPSTCRSVNDLGAYDDCFQLKEDATFQDTQVAVSMTYTGQQTQPPYVVRGSGAYHNSSVQTAGQDNLSITNEVAAGWMPLDLDDNETGFAFLMPPLVATSPANPYRINMSVTPVSASTVGLPSDSQSVVVNPSCLSPVAVTCTRKVPAFASPAACLQNSSSRTIEANNNRASGSFPNGGDCMYYECSVRTFGQLYFGQAVDGQIMCPGGGNPEITYQVPNDAGYTLRFIDKGRSSGTVDDPAGSADGVETDADGDSGESNGVELQFGKGSVVTSGMNPIFNSTGSPPSLATTNFSIANVTEPIVDGIAAVYVRARSSSRAASQTGAMIVRLQETTSGSPQLDPVTLVQSEVTFNLAPDGELPGRVTIEFVNPEVLNSGVPTSDPIYTRHAATNAAFATEYGITSAGANTDYRNLGFFSRVAVVKVQKLNGGNINTGSTSPIDFSLSGATGSLYRHNGGNPSANPLFACQTTLVSGPVATDLVGSTFQGRACVVSDGNPALAPSSSATTTVTASLNGCPVAKQPLCQTSGSVNVKSVRREVNYQFPMTRTSGSSQVDFAGFTLVFEFNDGHLIYSATDPASPTGQDFLAPLGVLLDNLIVQSGSDRVRILQSTGSNAYIFPAGSPGSREVIRTRFTIKERCSEGPCDTLATRLPYDPGIGEITQVVPGAANSSIQRYVTAADIQDAPLKFDPPTAVHSNKNYGQP